MRQNEPRFSDLLNDIQPKINWKFAIQGEALSAYRQVDNRYFEPLSRPLAKMEVREHLPGVTPSQISAIVDALLEDKERLFDDAIFIKDKRRIIGFKNKVFDIQAGSVRPYQHNDYVLAPLPYDVPEQINPEIEQWFLGILRSWVGEDAGDWFANLLAYLLFIYPNGEDLWANFFGGGANGKSVCLEIMESILGDEKVIGCDLKNINRFSGDTFRDKWLVVGRDSSNVVSEQATSFIKTYTGDPKLLVEKKGGASFDVRNPGKLIVSTNSLIESKDRSYGWYRRLVPVPFFSRFKRNPKFKDALIRRVPDIARVLLHRAYLIRHNDVSMMDSAPQSVKQLRNETRMLNDRLAAFWHIYFHRERCWTQEDDEGRVIEHVSSELDWGKLADADNLTVSEMYEKYSSWHYCEFGETALAPSLKAFGGPYGAFLQSEAGEYFEYHRGATGRVLRVQKKWHSELKQVSERQAAEYSHQERIF